MSGPIFTRLPPGLWSCTSSSPSSISSSRAQDIPSSGRIAAHVGTPPVPFFVDACSGPGTLGLAAACLGVPHVVMNDAWYASAFWSAFNLKVNRVYFDVEKVRIYEAASKIWPVTRSPGTGKDCRNVGRQMIEVYQGDFRKLDRVIPRDAHPVAALDVFEKNNQEGDIRLAP